MNKEQFYNDYPLRKPDSCKFDNGRVLFVSGSYGMAGAAILNLLGVRCTGASYIHSVVPKDIYPIVASNEPTVVYHPDSLDDEKHLKKLGLILKVDSIGIGSGLNNHPYRMNYLRYILEEADVPIIADACAIDLLKDDPTMFELNKKLIITPHLGEFMRLSGLNKEKINNDREKIASSFAREKNVILVLKGPKTIVCSPEGKIYRNNSGNEALARAGSGDILTGMISGLCSLYDDIFQAVCDAVWLHGYLCDKACEEHSREVFDLMKYNEYADHFFLEMDKSRSEGGI